MNQIKKLGRLNLSHIETLVFAGGGNRCWWQAGMMSHLLKRGWTLPKQLVGTSAGAAIAAACITEGPKAALSACLRLYSTNKYIFDWHGIKRLRFNFAHHHIYPAWVESFVNAGTFETLLHSHARLRVALTRPARALGLTASVAVGTLAYLIDRYLWHSVHPRLPKLLGLRQDFFDIQDCKTAQEAQVLLRAAAAAPPFMRSLLIAGKPAIDGGYSDNAPVHEQTSEEKSRTLVFLTRYYPDLPRVFRWRERAYCQPSQRVPVSTWDCTSQATVQKAFSLGESDAAALFKGSQLCDA